MYLCSAACAGVVRYGSLPPLSTFTYASAHRGMLVRGGTGRYSIKYIHTGVEGHGNTRQWLAQGIPALQRIPSTTTTFPWYGYVMLANNFYHS